MNIPTANLSWVKGLEEIEIPKIYEIEQQFQKFDRVRIEDDLVAQLQGKDLALEGRRVAICIGSRGLSAQKQILAELVNFLRSREALPEIVTAMGGHGGGTAQSQLAILKEYGVLEGLGEIPKSAGLSTVHIGQSDKGADCYVAKQLLTADHVVLLNQVKPHVGFSGPIESGLVKMMAVGVGGTDAARAIHESGYVANFSERVIASARVVEGALPSVIGIAMVEDAYGDIARLHVLENEEIFTEEPGLLKWAKEHSATLPFGYSDIALIDEIGKDIAGSSYNPNVIGRAPRDLRWDKGTQVKRMVAFALTSPSLGNAVGVGMFDVITQELASQINWRDTIVNCMNARLPEACALPLIARNKTDAVRLAIGSLSKAETSSPKIIRIRNTLRLDKFWVSEALRANLPARAVPTGRVLRADEALP